MQISRDEGLRGYGVTLVPRAARVWKMRKWSRACCRPIHQRDMISVYDNHQFSCPQRDREVFKISRSRSTLHQRSLGSRENASLEGSLSRDREITTASSAPELFVCVVVRRG